MGRGRHGGVVQVMSMWTTIEAIDRESTRVLSGVLNAETYCTNTILCDKLV